jgi:hypothetical protein
MPIYRAQRKRHMRPIIMPYGAYSIRCFLVFLWNDAHAENVHELSSHLAFFI